MMQPLPMDHDGGFVASHDVRPSYRPPIGMPLRSERERKPATLLSALFHALIIALLIFPLFQPNLGDAATGAGGPGPAGGGGGGTGGTGGAQRPDQVQERLRYIKVTDQPIPTPSAIPPVEEKKEEEKKTPELEIRIEPISSLNQPIDVAITAGVGGGTGSDNTTGSGSGTGGGVGSGVGTGRGTGQGPGTGGGPGTVYPPQPTHLFLPPMPIPERVKPFTLVAKFDVDSTGRVLAIEFNPTRDAGYNRRLREALAEVRFKPAIRWDGRPVREIGQVVWQF